MWPRIVELMLGVWLTLGGFLFRGTPNAADYIAVDAVSGSLVVLFSLLSFWHALRRAHLATLAVALGLVAHGYFSAPRPGPPAAQNEIVVGLLLLLFAIVPTEATKPPAAWRRAGRT